MRDLNLVLLQQALMWQDPPANRARFGALLLSLIHISEPTRPY